jgi:tetratricopeptide (TPR) repeat protein
VIRGYEALIASFPDSATPYSSLTLTYAARQQWDAAWRTIDRWTVAAPDSYSAKYAIGRTAAESGQRSEQGEKALRDYLTHELGPGEPSLAAAHWRLGMILEKRGQRDEARSEYEVALKLDPKLKGAKDGLARVK